MLSNAACIRALFAASLLGAMINHASMLWQHGLYWDYGGVSAAQAFWTSLTFVDPVALALLFLRPVTGIWLTVLIIVSDILYNTWFGFTHGAAANWMRYSQVAFLTVAPRTFRAA